MPMMEPPTNTDMSENENTTGNPANEEADERLSSRALFGWIAISERLPELGDVIACAAENSEGERIFWAGTIIEIWPQGFAVIEEKAAKTRPYILTPDTLWILLPSLPNS